MKQGQAKTSIVGSTKVEPKSMNVNLHHVAGIGQKIIYTSGTKPPMYEGRGIRAPMVSEVQHHKGSQGKHK